jgi:TP901-1 family phage major tail protein
MTAQRGRDLLLKLDQTGTGTFITVAGLRSHTLTFNSETVDVSSQDSTGQWRELLAGAGLKSASIKGSGLFKDAASDAAMRQYFFDGTIRDWQVVVPSFGIVQGPFQIASLDVSAKHDGEVTFDAALESAGVLTFTAT